MKSFIKNLTIFTCICYATTLFAAGAENKINVNAENIPPEGLNIGITGSFLKPYPEKHDLKYATLNDGSDAEIHPGYSAAGGMNIGYLFQRTANDIKLVYNFFNSKNYKNSTSGSNINANNVDDDDGVTYTNASAKADYRVKQADVTFGHYFRPYNALTVHPMVGVRYAQVKRRKEENYSGGSSNVFSSETLDATFDSRFNGTGPLVALDGRYNFNQNKMDEGFGLVGYADMAMLIGDVNSIYKQTLSNLPFFGSGSTTASSLHSGDLARIVPAFDGSIGIDYRHRFNKDSLNTYHPELIAALGYEASFYYKAINTLYPTSASGSEKTNSNISFNGPFLSLTYRGIPL